MRIRMLKTESGSASAMGNASRRYEAGEIVHATRPWQIDVCKVFLEMGSAELVASLAPAVETKPETGLETKPETGLETKPETGLETSQGTEGEPHSDADSESDVDDAETAGSAGDDAKSDGSAADRPSLIDLGNGWWEVTDPVSGEKTKHRRKELVERGLLDPE